MAKKNVGRERFIKKSKILKKKQVLKLCVGLG